MPKRITVANLARQQLRFSSNNEQHTVVLQWNTVDAHWFLDSQLGDTVLMQGKRVVTNVNLLANASLKLKSYNSETVYKTEHR